MDNWIAASVLFVLSFCGVANAQGEAIGDVEAARRAIDTLSDFRREAPLPVYGSQLFEGPPMASRTAGDGSYILQIGDRVAVRAFGAYNADVVGQIDANGMLFIPEVGPVALAGKRAAQLQDTIEQAVRQTFTSNVRVYATLSSPGAISVYVTGDVVSPGRYIGGSNDDVLYFIGLANGVHPERGSYRDIRVLRNGEQVVRIDLYSFLQDGSLPDLSLMPGDTILVRPRGSVVSASGDVLAEFEFELRDDRRASVISHFARPEPSATAVVVKGTRNNEPFLRYLPLASLDDLFLENGDSLTYRTDVFGSEIAVAVQSTSPNAEAVYIVPRQTKLTELLAQVPLDRSVSDLDAIHLNRLSVARQQREALNASLDRLERTASLSVNGLSTESTNIAATQAQVVSAFVARARTMSPRGTVTVMENGDLLDLTLEDGDVVVVPDLTDVLIVAGEVMAPGAFVAHGNATVRDFIERAGGFQDHANKSKFVVLKRSGAAFQVSGRYRPEPGDQILVVPRSSHRGFLLAKDITEVIFQLALSTATVARL